MEPELSSCSLLYVYRNIFTCIENINRSISLSTLSYVDKFIPNKANLAKLKYYNAVQWIWFDISRCILVHIDIYSCK